MTVHDTVLLCCPQMEELAQRIVESATSVVSATVDWARFDDGFPDLMIRNVDSLRGRDVAFLACFEAPATILEQLSVICAVPRYGAGSFKIILPYFPTGTMERVSREGEIATANTLARMLSITPLSMLGPAEIIVYDIHALQERFYFTDNVIPRLESAVPLFEERLNRISEPETLAIAFPDEGALKRFGTQFERYPQILCHKLRQGEKRVVTLVEGEPEGRHVVIVDDLVRTGGTILECRKALSDRGARQVSAFVTHGVFPLDSWNNFFSAGFSHFWITDSCPAAAWSVNGRPPFEVLSLADDIARLLSEGRQRSLQKRQEP